MNNPYNISPQEQQQQQQQLQNFILSDYKAKREAGIISFEKRNGSVVLAHKQLDSTFNEIDPILMPISADQIARLRISRRQQRDQIELQYLDAKAKLEAFDREDAELYAALEQDVTAAEAIAVPASK